MNVVEENKVKISHSKRQQNITIVMILQILIHRQKIQNLQV
jgi:hypothetical protein